MSCGEACGWMAAAASMLAFGSFGVPIKSEAAKSVDVDPLVFQSYKTFMCFCTSWLVLLFGESFEFTPWGIVSAIFWVPGGAATVYAVKAAGLAIGIGIGSSCIVLVSFFWGIFIFKEPVHSTSGACLAVLALMVGLLGMSYYSSPAIPIEYDTVALADSRDGPTSPDTVVETNNTENELQLQSDSTISRYGKITTGHKTFAEQIHTVYVDDPSQHLEQHGIITQQYHITSTNDNIDQTQSTYICAKKVQKRHVGMLAAAFCGLWGGSIMAPMKWCKSNTKGTHYLLSFSMGAAIVTIALWLLRYWGNVLHQKGDFVGAYRALPSFHIRVMWKAGCLSGLLWSIGNYFSLISVFYLGEGVGYPLVQSSILVSGLWGIFYFGEVRGRQRMTMWLLSSLVTVFGILLLSYQHHKK